MEGSLGCAGVGRRAGARHEGRDLRRRASTVRRSAGERDIWTQHCGRRRGATGAGPRRPRPPAQRHATTDHDPDPPMPASVSRPVSYRPLHPEPADQGDPYLLAVPEGVPAAHRYYVYVTRDETSDGRGGRPSPGAFPVYASDDLATWTAMGPSLREDATRRAHWAPCVWHVPGLDRPYVMLYSRSVGIGEEAHVGHAIRRADAERPEGPFVDSGHVLTPDTDFAI